MYRSRLFRYSVLLATLTLASFVLLIVGQAGAAEPEGGSAGAAEAKTFPSPQLEAKMLTGETWLKMSVESRQAFVLGMGQLADIEQEILGLYPELRRDGFVEKVAEALEGLSIDAIVGVLDGYYAAHPEKTHTAVMQVLWDEMIKPKISTICGKPVKK